MHDTLKEIIGFISRWCLLALAGITVVIVGWAALTAASMTAVSAKAAVILSDEVWRQPRRGAHATGYLISSGAILLRSQFLSCSPGSAPSIVSGSGERIYPIAVDRPDGPWNVSIQGIPYGSFAFQRDRAICKVISSQRRVLAVDAELVENPPDSCSEELESFLAELQSRGQVVLADTGSPEHYRDLRNDLRYRYRQVPQVFAMPCTQDIMPAGRSDGVKDFNGYVLDHMARTLRCAARKPRPQIAARRDWMLAAVITANSELASATAPRFHTHLITGKRQGELKPTNDSACTQGPIRLGNPVCHASLTELIRYLDGL